MRFLTRAVVRNNKSMIRHEACSTFVHNHTQILSITNSQTELDEMPRENLINFMSFNVGRFLLSFCPFPF